MKTNILLLLTLFNLITFAAGESYDDEATNANAAFGCSNGPDDLAVIGAQRICMDSTAYEGRRCFYVFVPECATTNSPLVFSIHGYSSCPALDAAYTGWVQKAIDKCFVLVFPLGNTNPEVGDTTCWTFPGGMQDDYGFTAFPCCCSSLRSPSNKTSVPSLMGDATFLRQIAVKVVQDLPATTLNTVSIDPKRIYMAGHSNGCMSAMAMGILHSDMVSAVGCHSGFASTPFPEQYSPTPMMFIHGNADYDVPFEGSMAIMSQPSMYATVAEANGCTETNEVESINSMTNNYTTYTSTSCINNADVMLVEIDNAGHVPYYGLDPTGFGETWAVPTMIDTTQMAWDFISKYSSSSVPDDLLVGEEDDDEGDDEKITLKNVKKKSSKRNKKKDKKNKKSKKSKKGKKSKKRNKKSKKSKMVKEHRY